MCQCHQHPCKLDHRKTTITNAKIHRWLSNGMFSEKKIMSRNNRRIVVLYMHHSTVWIIEFTFIYAPQYCMNNWIHLGMMLMICSSICKCKLRYIVNEWCHVNSYCSIPKQETLINYLPLLGIVYIRNLILILIKIYLP